MLQQDAGAVADRRREPFDADGDGTILGEGLGMVVLKRLADAERDGDRIYAVLQGDRLVQRRQGERGLRPAARRPDAVPEERLRPRGRLARDTIELVEAHGTGTKVGDAVEATALAQVFREANPDGTWCASARSSRRSATPRRRPARPG